MGAAIGELSGETLGGVLPAWCRRVRMETIAPLTLPDTGQMVGPKDSAVLHAGGPDRLRFADSVDGIREESVWSMAPA